VKGENAGVGLLRNTFAFLQQLPHRVCRSPLLPETMPMADESHLSIYRRGVLEWNCWRSQNPNVKPDLKGADLSKPSLPDAWEIDLSNADLRGANLAGTLHMSGIFASALLTEANLDSVNFLFADLSGADLRGANLNSAGFTSANLTRADLSNIQLGGMANFVKATMAGAKLIGSQFTSCYFNEAVLEGADLSNANLSGSVFVSTNLQRTNFRGANLSKTRADSI